MKKADHTILNYTDTPVKILVWTMGELTASLGPLMLGIVVDEFLLGSMMTGLDMWGMRRFKRHFGKGQLVAVMYWYLPESCRFWGIPPSCIREYL